MMVWSNSLILGLGGALILVPVLLHLLMQPKPKRMMFPALKFLQERQQQNRSKMRLRHFLLLLLRCLLIGLLVLALAGPTVASRDFGNWLTLGGIGISTLLVGLLLLAVWLRPKRNQALLAVLLTLFLAHLAFGGWGVKQLLTSEGGISIGDSQAPIAVAIVIDSSPRMDYKHDNQTRLVVAKKFAQSLIKQFPPDSQVSVVFNDFDTPFFSVDVAAADRRVETMEPVYRDAPLPTTLLRGIELLEKAEEERKEIYLITDLTKQGWGGDDIRPLFRRLEAAAEIGLFVIDVGVEKTQNFSLGDLAISNASLSTAGSFAIDTSVERKGPAEQKTIRLTIESSDPTRPIVRDGQALFPEGVLQEMTQTVDLREDGSQAITFSGVTALEKGTYHGRIEIEGGDGLNVDNVRFFTLDVDDAGPILVVHPADVSPRNLVSTLSAPAIAGTTRRSQYQCDVVLQDDFVAMEDLAGYSAIFLLNPLPLATESWEKLQAYVVRGGGLGIMLGNNASQAGFADSSFETPIAQELMGGRIDLIWDAADQSVSLRPQDLSHPLFKMLRRYQENILWDRVPVYLHWEQEMDDRGAELPTQVLIRFSNGQPALIERQVGAGRVLTLLTPISDRSEERGRRTWNELSNFSTFVPWLLNQMMTEFLTQPDADSLNISIGQVASFTNDLAEFPESYQVFSPVADRAPSLLRASDSSVKYRFTDSPGHYRLKGSFDGQPLLRGFSANLESYATVLTRILPDELDEFLGVDRYQLARDEDEIQQQQGTVRKGMEFYPLLMTLMLVLFGLEYLMSNRFYGGSA